MQLGIVMDKYYSSLTKRYYYYAFSTRDLRGISIINLRNGKRQDIVTAPQLDLTGKKIMDQYAISPDGMTLLSIGSGLNPAHIEKRTRRARTMPKYALLTYNLRDNQFRSDNFLLKRAKNLNYFGWDTKLYLTPTPKYIRSCRKYHDQKNPMQFLKKNKKVKDCWFHALHGSILKRDKKTTNFLLRSGLDINRSRSSEGLSLLAHVIYHDNPADLKYFLRYKPDPKLQIIDNIDNIKKTPSQYCKERCISSTKKKNLPVITEYEKRWNKLK